MPGFPAVVALTLALHGAPEPVRAPAEARPHPSAVRLASSVAEAVRVQVDGVSGEIRRNIRAHLSIYQRRSEPELAESTVRALHRRAPEEIRRALRPFGYYRPAIESELRQTDDGWRARYRVDPGAAVRYATVNVMLEGAGADDPVLHGVLPEVGVAEGEVLLHPEWEEAKQTLLNQAAGRGYLDVEVTRSRVEVDTTAGTARAELRVRTGPRYRFGRVDFPETPFTSSFMGRYVVFRPGEPFDLDALLAMQRALSSSDYFRLVQAEPLRDEADSLRVPIRVSLEMQERNSYTVGVGYGTDTGIRGTASGRRRWLNPYGHRLEAELRASLRSQLFQGQYVIPLSSGPSNRVAVSTALIRDDFEGLESRRVYARVELDHIRGGWREVASVRLAEEWYRDGTDERSSTLLIPELAWSRVWGDEVVYPRRGLRLQLGLAGASEAVLSDVAFLQATARLSVARGLWPSARLLLRGGAGTTEVDDLLDLPVSLRLFAGGDQSVRGFDYRSIGPVGSDGTVTGGRHRLIGSIELEQMVYAGLGFAVFTDAGNVFATRSGIALDDVEQGAGAGLRWRSPIGLLRVDVAWPVSRTDPQPKLHFVVGGVL